MKKPGLSQRFRGLLEKYGKIALIVHFAIFGLAIAGFFFAIKLGVHIDGITGTAGTLGAAYAATQLIKPLRIGATLLLTPLIGRLVGRDIVQSESAANVGADENSQPAP